MVMLFEGGVEGAGEGVEGAGEGVEDAAPMYTPTGAGGRTEKNSSNETACYMKNLAPPTK